MKPIGTLTHLSWDTIQAYLAGKLNRSENHAVEEHLLDCEMCADAVEGLSQTPPAQTEQIIKKTAQQIDKKVQKKKKRGILKVFYPYWAIAASLVLVLGIVLVLLLKMPSKKEMLAQKNTTQEEKASGNSSPAPLEEVEAPKEKEEIVEKKESKKQEKPSFQRKEQIQEPKTEKSDLGTDLNTQDQEIADVAVGGEKKLEEKTDLKTETKVTEVQTVTNQESEKISAPIQDDLLKDSKNKETDLAKKRSQSTPPKKQELAVLDTLSIELPKEEIKRMEIPTEIFALKPNFHILLDSLKIDFVKIEYQSIPLNAQIVETLALQDEKVEKENQKADQEVKTEVKIVEETKPTPSESQKTEDVLDKSLPQKEQAEKEVKKEENVQPEPELPANSSVYPEGGWEKFQEYVKTNLRYPEDAKRDQIQGMIRLEVLIGADGKVKDVQVKRGLIESCNLEAIRLVRMYKWFAARQDGKPVEESIKVKINFE